MKKVLQVILHILGFPALIGLLVYSSIDMIKGGLNYGVYVFVGIIVTVLFALIYFLVVGIMAKSAKKKGKKNIYRQTFVAMILSLCLLGGFWIGLDLGLPDFLKEQTSSTIFYEDLADNYYARSVVNQELINEYIKRNVDNGNLKSKTVEEYQKEGVRNAEVANLLKVHVASIKLDGYETFKGPNIDLALADGRMTIAVLVHLLLDTRKIPDQEFYLYDAETDKVVTDPVEWNILDMMGTPMDITDIAMLSDEGYEDFIEGLGGTGGLLKLAAPTATRFRKLISDIANGIVPDITEGLTGSPIFLGFNGMTLQLVPSNESRGVLDYQSMGWLEANGLIYAIVTLFSTRKLFLIWAGVLVLTNFLIGMLRGMGKEMKDKEMRCAPRGNNGGYNGGNYGGGNYVYGSVAPQRMPQYGNPYNNGDMRNSVRRYDVNNFR